MNLQAIIDKFESNSKGRLLGKKKNPKEDFKAEC